MGKKILKKVAEEAFLAVVMIVVFVAIAYGGFALIDTFTNPSEKAATSDVYTGTTPAETTAPASPTTEAPADAPVAQAPAATVNGVTEPTPAVKPEVVDPESIGTVGPDGAYTAAPPPQNPGEPPVASNWGAPPPQDAKLPGEPGYVPPAG